MKTAGKQSKSTRTWESHVYLGKDLWNRLDNDAKEQNRSMTAQIRQIIQDYYEAQA